MNLIDQALRGAQGPAASSASAAVRGALLVGAGGHLGSALLEQLLARGRFAPLRVAVREAMSSSMRGFEPFRDLALLPDSDAPAVVDPRPVPLLAFLVFERARHSNGRDDAFVLPAPDELLPWARQLAAAGVRRLLVVVPHAPAMLPAALRGGFANRDEQQLAALGFEHLLLLRPAARAVPSPTTTPRESWLRRCVDLWFDQFRWMVPASEQAVRSARLAALVVQLAEALDDAPSGTRVVPPEVFTKAAAAADATAVLRAWLRGGGEASDAGPAEPGRPG